MDATPRVTSIRIIHMFFLPIAAVSDTVEIYNRLFVKLGTFKRETGRVNFEQRRSNFAFAPHVAGIFEICVAVSESAKPCVAVSESAKPCVAAKLLFGLFPPSTFSLLTSLVVFRNTPLPKMKIPTRCGS